MRKKERTIYYNPLPLKKVAYLLLQLM
jgi:hypothetical protein